ncbi:GntR family transcriptional regulator [Actinobacteria bacterium YIM 96077]|uniref:GntR family transcriptional regulator n=1 Tax=Phytoactinopolyspora halophila TaxID=1981511 RepID=A0A329QRR7_9ACTN|nr:winged helix-turn-helix domain-containing protein [Phytoactinopolyspora halophila]AYY11360.1 GntR family transcriptional regulator [Actinobacteria bacterium YIM 96077]RAW14691.1 GntR family transcriptional regulator [Phytoactinopolyspora halophila]
MSDFVPNWQIPVYIATQAADYLTALISDGAFSPGARLPSERQLADELGVSIGTVRRATQILRERGLVKTLPSRGTYVNEHVRIGGGRDE